MLCSRPMNCENQNSKRKNGEDKGLAGFMINAHDEKGTEVVILLEYKSWRGHFVQISGDAGTVYFGNNTVVHCSVSIYRLGCMLSLQNECPYLCLSLPPCRLCPCCSFKLSFQHLSRLHCKNTLGHRLWHSGSCRDLQIPRQVCFSQSMGALHCRGHVGITVCLCLRLHA